MVHGLLYAPARSRKAKVLVGVYIFVMACSFVCYWAIIAIQTPKGPSKPAFVLRLAPDARGFIGNHTEVVVHTTQADAPVFFCGSPLPAHCKYIPYWLGYRPRRSADEVPEGCLVAWRTCTRYTAADAFCRTLGKTLLHVFEDGFANGPLMTVFIVTFPFTYTAMLLSRSEPPWLATKGTWEDHRKWCTTKYCRHAFDIFKVAIAGVFFTHVAIAFRALLGWKHLAHGVVTCPAGSFPPTSPLFAVALNHTANTRTAHVSLSDLGLVPSEGQILWVLLGLRALYAVLAIALLASSTRLWDQFYGFPSPPPAPANTPAPAITPAPAKPTDATPLDTPLLLLPMPTPPSILQSLPSLPHEASRDAEGTLAEDDSAPAEQEIDPPVYQSM